MDCNPGVHVISNTQPTLPSPTMARAAPPQADRDIYCLASAGYIVLRNVFDDSILAQMLAIGEAFEDEVEQFVRRGGSGALRHSWPLRTTRALYAIAREFQDAAMHPGIHAIARAYLGDFVIRDCLIQSNMPD